jgi:hypothetical protein
MEFVQCVMAADTNAPPDRRANAPQRDLQLEHRRGSGGLLLPCSLGLCSHAA